MTKNAFYFTSKALLLLKIFKFLSLIFGHVESNTFGHIEQLDWKDKVNFKIYDITTWWTNNFNILTSISRSKSNQAMKFVQREKHFSSNIIPASGVILLFGLLPSQASDIEHFNTFSRPRENQLARWFFVKISLLLFFLISKCWECF